MSILSLMNTHGISFEASYCPPSSYSVLYSRLKRAPNFPDGCQMGMIFQLCPSAYVYQVLPTGRKSLSIFLVHLFMYVFVWACAPWVPVKPKCCSSLL